MPISSGMSRAQAAAVVGVRPDAPRPEVLTAFRARALHCHPDTGGDPARFKRLVQARDVLLRDGRPTPAPRITFVHPRLLARTRRRRHVAAIVRRLGLGGPTRVR